jgi:hypothetical protein
MIKIIITFIVVIIILALVYIVSKQIKQSNKQYNSNLKSVVNQLNDSQYSEFQYDIELRKGLENLQNNVTNNYVTKDSIANQVTSESIIANEFKSNAIKIKDTQITAQEIANKKDIIINNNLKVTKNKIDISGEFNLAGYPVATQKWVNKNSTPQWNNIQNKPDILQNNTQTDTVINDIKFSKAGFPSNNPNYSEFINDTTSYKQLIIAGNKSSGTRKVGIWDQLDVHGDLNVINKLSIQKAQFDKAPTPGAWNPITQQNDFVITNTQPNSSIVLVSNNQNIKVSGAGVDTTSDVNVSGKINASTNICVNDTCLSKNDLTGILGLQTNIKSLADQIQKIENSPKIDCVVGQWGSCDKPCGGGTQTRSIVTAAVNNGVVCPALSQQCNQQACAIDCKVSDWSACDKTCGGGTQTRTITQQAQNGGAACPALSQQCNSQACPVNCAVSGWSACDKSCGGGTQTRTITTAAANGGAACPSLTQSCNQQACPVDCVVSGWSACDKSCGGGTQTRSVTQQPQNGGQACPALSQSCNQQSCAVDCVVSGWSACDKSCGGGTQTRSVTQQPQNGGQACPALSQSCNQQGCVVDCAVSGWSACDKSCGGGTQTRSVTQQPQNGGQACPALSQSCNQQGCVVDCAVGAWGGCSKSCGGGIQYRSITQQPQNGGQACPATSQSCNQQGCSDIGWRDTFYQGQAPTQTQANNWSNFRQSLPNRNYFNVIISGSYDMNGKDINNVKIATDLANALRNKTNYQSPSINGNIWTYCAARDELWINPPDICNPQNCPNGYIIRPTIGNQNWGGINTRTCDPPTQTMYLTFTPSDDNSHPLFDNGKGYSCPTGKTTFNYSGSLSSTDAYQAIAACEACYGVGQCQSVSGDCAGSGYGLISNPYGKPIFGNQAGCSGAAGRAWLYGNSYDTFGTWA